MILFLLSYYLIKYYKIMISLQDYIYENENINEGFLMNALTKRTVKNMDSKDLFTGILNM